MSPDHDLYQVLGVAAQASAAEIQAGYYRAVRRHPPERDPEGFRRVQDAYDTLNSPTKRRDYDDERATDTETGQLVEEGRRLLENGDPEATKPLLRALARRPDSLVVSDLLIQAFIVAEQGGNAVRLVSRLIAREPDNPTHHRRLAQAYRGMDRNGDALESLETAVRLARDDPWPTVELAYLYSELGNADQAVALLDGAIHHDGAVDFRDIMFFQTLCRIHVGEGQLRELEAVHREIFAILPPDRDTRAYIAWFYYRDALAMARLGHYAAGLKTIEEAAAIDDSLPDLDAIRTRLHHLHGLVVESSTLKDDESIGAVLRIAIGAQVFHSLYGENAGVEADLGRAMDAILREATIENSQVVSDIAMVKNRYPEVTEAVGEWLEGLAKVFRETDNAFRRVECCSCQAELVLEIVDAQGDSISDQGYFVCDECGARVNQYGRRVPQADAASGCFVVTAACGSATAYPVVVLRRFRDERLTTSVMGRFAMRLYAEIGPVAARAIRANGTLRGLVYRVLVRTASLLDHPQSARCGSGRDDRRQGTPKRVVAAETNDEPRVVLEEDRDH